MVVANRWLFHSWQGKGFPFPVLTTMFHMWLKVVFSRVVIRLQVSRGPGSRGLAVLTHSFYVQRSWV